MAKLSKASTAQRDRPPRKDLYDVPVNELHDESEESDGNASPSDQLLREANAGPPSSSTLPAPPLNRTPERPPPSTKVPSSRKSVHFEDPVDHVAAESASLLRGPIRGKPSATAKTGPKGKLVRPSYMPAPIVAKTQPVQKSLPLRKDQLPVESPSAKKTLLREGSGEAKTLCPTISEAGERRSGRSHQDVATYNDRDTARLAAGLRGLENSKQASEARSTTPTSTADVHDGRSPGARWQKEEVRQLRQAREAGQTWEDIQKILPHRTIGALKVYAAKHNIFFPTSIEANRIQTNSVAHKKQSQSLRGKGRDPSPTSRTRTKNAHVVHEKESVPDQAKRTSNEWTKEEIALLKRLHSAGLSVKEMQKSLHGRTEGAITARYSILKLGPVNKPDTVNSKKRKTTDGEQNLTSAAKRRRVQESSASNSSSLSEPQSGIASTINPSQVRPSREQQKSSTPSKKGRTELGHTESHAPKSSHQRVSSSDVGEENASQSESDKFTDGGVEDEDARDADTENDTAESRAHALVKENYTNEDEDAQAPGDEDDAYQYDRNDSALDINDEDPDAHLMPRLFNQFGHLKKIVEATISLQAHVDELGVRRPAEPLFEEFDTIRRRIRTSYKALIDPASEEYAMEDKRIITRSVNRLQHLVRDLNPDAPPSHKPYRLLTNIYAFVFPDFLKILATASFSLVKRTESDDDITSPDLLEVIRIIGSIVDLGSRAPKWKTKVDHDLKLARPIKNDIVAPLKKILKEFERQRKRIEKEEQQAEESLRRTQELKRERTEREIEKRRAEEISSKRDRLRDLYIWRMSVESDLDRRIGRLAQPNLQRREKVYPLDANGEPFEREAVFKPRSSIPHMDRLSAAEEDEDWTDEELEALQQGLAEFAHDGSFWMKFFESYCYSHGSRRRNGSRGGPLRDRNVAEILKEMAKFRDYTIEDYAEEDVPGWLLDIPDMGLIPLL